MLTVNSEGILCRFRWPSRKYCSASLETAPMKFKTHDFKNMILDSAKKWVTIVDPDFDDGSGIC